MKMKWGIVLSDTAIRKAKPGLIKYQMAGGLHLLVSLRE